MGESATSLCQTQPCSSWNVPPQVTSLQGLPCALREGDWAGSQGPGLSSFIWPLLSYLDKPLQLSVLQFFLCKMRNLHTKASRYPSISWSFFSKSSFLGLSFLKTTLRIALRWDGLPQGSGGFPSLEMCKQRQTIILQGCQGGDLRTNWELWSDM